MVKRPFSLARLHVPQGETTKYLEAHDYADVRDLLLVVGAIGPIGPAAMAVWFEPPDWAPVVQGGLALPMVEGHARRRALSNADSPAAIELLQAWIRTAEPRRAELRVALGRLNSAIRGLSTVNVAIDLGIALEALFLTDMPEDRGELSFRLRVRAARLLGTDATDRQRIARLVGDLYSVRSSAVHTGKIPGKVRSRTTEELLGDGFDLVALALRKVILQGRPDWDSLVHG